MFEAIQGKIGLVWQQLRFLQYERAFGERDTDIYIASFPRSGTTLLQVIVYHLIHDGGMTYAHLDDVSPWLRNLAMKKLPVPVVPEPRVIKTHDPYSLFPPDKKGKFLFVIRNPADVAVSNYYNWKNYNDPDLKPGEVFDKLIRTDSAGGYFNFNRAWLENKKGFLILYLQYEELLNNKAREIERVANFLDLPLHPEKLNELLELSSFDYMKHNEEKFGEKRTRDRGGAIYNQFIRNGAMGEGEVLLTEEQLAFCKTQFGKLIKGQGKNQ